MPMRHIPCSILALATLLFAVGCAARGQDRGALPATVRVREITLKRPAAALSPAERRAQSFFALNGSKIYHVPEKIDGLVAERFGWMKELGVEWDRIDIWWGVTEPSPGVWDFSRGDFAFEQFEKHGVQWYPILCYGSAWWKDKSGPHTDEDRAAFVEYVRRTVTRYRGRAPYWSLWNEPNISVFWSPQPDAEAYAALAKEVYPVFKAADPDAKLAAFAIAPLGRWDRGFVERCYQSGIEDSFDVFDYHYYRSYPPEREVPAEFEEIRAVMTRYGDSKPIWISESGVSTIGLGEERQAAYVARNQLLALGLGVERFFYFDLQNWEDSNENQWDSQLGLVTASGKRKPSFYSYQTVVRESEHRDVIGRCEELGENVEGVLLRDPESREYVLAVWQTEDHATRRLDVDCVAGNIQIVPTHGATPKEVPDSSRARTIALDVIMHPVFVRGADPMTYLPMAGVRLSPAHAILATGESALLAVEAHPFIEHPIVTVKSFAAPAGISWDPAAQQLTIAAGASLAGKQRIEAVLTLEHGPAYDRRTVELRRSVIVEVVPPLTIVLRPYEEHGVFAAEAVLSNQMAREVGGALRVVQREPDGTERVLVETEVPALAPHEVRTVAVPLTRAHVDAVGDSAVWTAIFAGTASRPFHIVEVRLSDEAPVVDGDLGEWSGIPAMTNAREDQIVRSVGPWSPEIASARTRIWLTPDSLCLAADITDDDPMRNPHPPLLMWKGDSLELYAGFEGPTRRRIMDKRVEYQIGIAPVTKSGGPSAFWFHIDEPLATATVATARTEHGYALEASIPLAALKIGSAPRDGMLLGLDCTLDDLDARDIAPAGNDPGRAVVWNGTAMNWIDPSNWGMGIVRRGR